MGERPCGCDELIKAQNTVDPSLREALTGAAKELQEHWQCPCAGHNNHQELLPEDEACVEALQNVERLTGATGFKTCPNACLREGSPTYPAVQRVARARLYRDKGQLQLLEGKLVQQDLVEAMELVDRAVDARSKRELEDIRKKREQQQQSTDTHITGTDID